MGSRFLSKADRLLTAAICVVVAACASAQSPIGGDRPDILVIVADDLGYGDLGFTGSTDIQTSVIDSLAGNGVVASNGYVVHPYCGPSRAGLFTGRYPARFGMEFNVDYSPDSDR